jgi:hypothetical protein
LGTFWRVLKRKMLVNFVAIWSFFHSFGIFFGHLVCCAEKNLAMLVKKRESFCRL